MERQKYPIMSIWLPGFHFETLFSDKITINGKMRLYF